MKHPPYHLRPAKSIDRLILLDLIRCLAESGTLQPSQFTFYSLGGPFLEDMRLMHEWFPSMRLVSIEKDEDTIKRQRFHKPTRNIRIVRQLLKDFLIDEDFQAKAVFWLDYTDHKPGRFNEFSTLLQKLVPGSIVKITMSAEPSPNPFTWPPRIPVTPQKRAEAESTHKESFIQRYGDFSVDRESLDDSVFVSASRYAHILKQMIGIAASKSLLPQTGSFFKLLSAITYNDGTNMLSVTGIIVDDQQSSHLDKGLAKWRFVQGAWDTPPISLKLPVLSLKEVMHLEQHLPATTRTYNRMAKSLGYLIEDNDERNLEVLKNFCLFYKYFPKYAKILQ